MTHDTRSTKRQKRLLQAVYTAAIIACGVSLSSAHAVDSTWDGTTTDYNLNNNWNPNPPGVPNNLATFSGNAATDPTTTDFSTINELLFNSTARAYTFTNGAGLIYNLNGIGTNGIVNNSANNQFFVNNGTFNINNAQIVNNSTGGGTINFANYAALNFNGNAVASIGNNATLINSYGGDGDAVNGGGFGANGPDATVTFNSLSSAGSATLNSYAGTGGAVTGGGLGGNGGSITTTFNSTFNNTSTADTATINNYGGTGGAVTGGGFGGNGGGVTTTFNNTSTAGSATINNYAGTGGAVTVDGDGGGGGDTITNFNNTSTAGSATINNYGGTDGAVTGVGFGGVGGVAVTNFNNNASAGSANITNNNRSETDFYGAGTTAATSTIINNAGSQTQFYSGATAASANITNNTDGLLAFRSGSNAGTDTNNRAIINNTGGSTSFYGESMTTPTSAGTAIISNTNNGFTSFFDGTTAGNATINNGLIFTSGDGTTEFNDNSTAGNANINNGAFLGGNGTVNFNSNADAGNATITNYGGFLSGTGTTNFNGTSTGGTATVDNEGGALYIYSTGDMSGLTVTNNSGLVDISGNLGTGTTIGALSGAGDVFLGSKNLTIDNSNTDETISGVIQDGGIGGGTGGSLTKEGTGTLALTGDNTYTGPTTIANGTLQVDRSITSNTTINDDGLGQNERLTGNGRIFGNLTNNNGHVAPGRGAGALGTLDPYSQLTVLGNTVIDGVDSRLDTRVNGNGDSNSLFTTGTLSLDGQVTVDAEDQSTGGKYLVTNRYGIAFSDGGLIGNFVGDGIDEANSNIPTFLDASIEDDTLDVSLILRRNSLSDDPFLDSPRSDNQRAIFKSFDQGLDPMAPPLSANNEDLIDNFILNGPDALDQASGDALTVYPVAAQRASDRFNQRLMLHALQKSQSGDEYASMRAPRLVYTGDHYRNLLAAADGKAAPVMGTYEQAKANRSNIWAIIARANDNGDSDGNGPGFDARATEYQVGYNRQISQRTAVGISVGKSNGDVDVDHRNANGDLDTTSVGVSIRHDSDNWYASGLLSYSKHDIDSKRFTGIGTATANYDARTIALQGEVGKTIKRRKYDLQPNISLKIANTRQDDFTESGPGGLSVDSNNYNTRRLGIGLRIVSNDTTSRFRPYGFIGYEREFGDQQAELSNQLSGLSSFRVNSSDLGKNIFSLRVGTDARINDRFSVVGEIGGSWRSNQDSKYIYGGVKYAW